jgi:catechol 2,3-dioxygenase-like lactoylglutathione lyase family enzyme
LLPVFPDNAFKPPGPKDPQLKENLMPNNTSPQLSSARLWDAAVVVNDLDKTIKRLNLLGIGQPVNYGPPEGAEGLFYQGKLLESNMKVHLTRIGTMQIEFNQPDDKPNPWKDFLKKHGEGFHHLGFLVDDVEKEVSRLTSLGAEAPFYGKVKGKIGAAYVDLKVANLFIELTDFCGIPPFAPEKPVYPRAWDAGVVVKDLDAAMKRLETLGIGRFVQSGPPEGADGLFYRGKPLVSGFKGSGRRIENLQMDLIQPDGTSNPWSDFLNTRGEGIHHIGLQVKDVEKEVNRLTGLGAELLLYGTLKGKMGAAYVDLKLANLVIELTSFCSID